MDDTYDVGRILQCITSRVTAIVVTGRRSPCPVVADVSGRDHAAVIDNDYVVAGFVKVPHPGAARFANGGGLRHTNAEKATARPRLARPHTYFFFSSRRRHTRLQGDWSSDVCSSD